MSRRIKISCSPPIELFTISEREGKWEGDWGQLKGTRVGKLFGTVDRRVIDDALRGHEAPLRQALGIAPEGALRKLPSKECTEKRSCTYYDDQRCKLLAKETPWCFKPAELDLPAPALTLVSEVVGYWKSRIHVVVVREHA